MSHGHQDTERESRSERNDWRGDGGATVQAITKALIADAFPISCAPSIVHCAGRGQVL